MAPTFVLPDDKPKAAVTAHSEEEGGTGAASATEGAAPASAIELDGENEDEETKAEDDEEEKQDACGQSSLEQPTSLNEHRATPTDESVLSDDGDDLTIDDIVLDTSRTSKIDLQAVFALPSHLQKDMLNRILRDRRQEVRDKFIPLAGQPEAYSLTQISAFLATTALHRRIEAAKKKNRDEIEGVAAAAAGGGDAVTALLGPGKRIASRSDRFFVYKRAEDRLENDSDDDSDKSDTEGTGHVVAEIDSVADEARRSTLADATSTDSFADNVGPNGLGSLLARFKNKKRASHDDEEMMGRQPLSDFSVGSIADFAAQAQRQQARKRAVEEATAAWVAKNKLLAKHEPMLAIEAARRKRLKIDMSAEDERVGAQVAADATGDEKKSFSISFKTDDADASRGEHLSLFPASLFEPVAVDMKDVDKVPEVMVPSDTQGAVRGEEKVSADDDDDDDDVGA